MNNSGAVSLDLVLGDRALHWWLLPEKAIWAPSDQTLILADIHLGKAGHFRRHGIAIPAAANLENLARLSRMMDDLRPRKLLLLGDLFHSDLNPEWDGFVAWLGEERERLPDLDVELILGNHDAMPKKALDNAGIRHAPFRRTTTGILFSHAPEDFAQMGSPPTDALHVCGHWHPGVSLRGSGRQSLRLPCFALLQQKDYRQLILPAFGGFTGLHSIQPRSGDRCFVVAENEVLEISKT